MYFHPAKFFYDYPSFFTLSWKPFYLKWRFCKPCVYSVWSSCIFRYLIFPSEFSVTVFTPNRYWWNISCKLLFLWAGKKIYLVHATHFIVNNYCLFMQLKSAKLFCCPLMLMMLMSRYLTEVLPTGAPPTQWARLWGAACTHAYWSYCACQEQESVWPHHRQLEGC